MQPLKCRSGQRRTQALTGTPARPRGDRPGASGLPHVTQKLVLPHLVAAFLPLLPQLLQEGPDLLAGGNARPPDVVAAHRERGHGPPPHVPEEPVLALVLQQLTHARRGLGFPALSAKTKRLVTPSQNINKCSMQNFCLK